MKILRIIARLNVGGPARHVAWLTSKLHGVGVETMLVAGVVPAGEDDMTYFATAQGVAPVIIPEMSREVSALDAVTVWKLYRLMRRERPDIVHTHTAKAGTVGRVAGLLYRWLTPSALIGRPRACRFVHTYHGHIFHSYYGKWKTRLFLFIEKMLARLVTDRIVVISPQQFREIHEEFGVGRREQFAVIPLGLDMQVFADWSRRRGAARRELGAPDARDVLVGIVGRLTEIKNHRLFLEAAALCKTRRDEGARRGVGDGRRVRFVIVGDGHLRAELEAYACDLGLADDVIFTGLRDDPENFYPALDVLALTSLNEGTPLTLIEAMANARAVIATAVGGVVDLLGGLDTSLLRRPREWQVCERGLLVENHDAEVFSRGLDFLIEHEELREQMGERGRAFVAQNYSLERLTADVLHLYEELLTPSGRRDVSRAADSGTNQNISRVADAAARLKGD